MLPGRRHEIPRVEAFVSLEIPDSYDKLIEPMAGFVPFACSFALLTWLWYEHNVFFRRYGLQDPYTVTLNAILLFVVLFDIYPLKFLFHELGLTPLEVFDTRAAGGEHLVSASIGALTTVVALIAPPPYPVISGFTYFLMGPAHWIYGMRMGRRRRAVMMGTPGDVPATT